MATYKNLYRSTNPYYTRMMGHTEVVPFKYEGYEILLGKDNDKLDVTLDIEESFRACAIAATRTGKTFMIRRMLDELYHSGWACAILPDAKDEYGSSRNPIQTKFRNNLPPGELPKGLPMRVFRPFFFSELGKLPEGNEWVALELTDLSKVDFQTLCGFDKLPSKQKLDLDSLWLLILNKTISSVEEIETVCEENNWLKLWEKISFINECGLFDSRFAIDPVEVLKNKEVLVLNYADFDALDMRANSLDQIFLAIWLRKIIEAKKKGLLPNLMIFNDETARWVPRSGNPSCKKIILEAVDVVAAFGISFMFGFQRIDSVPEALVRQCKYKFLPYNVDRSTLEEVLKLENIITDMVRGKKLFVEILQTLKAKKFRWTIITKGDDFLEYVDCYSPISAHLESLSSFRRGQSK